MVRGRLAGLVVAAVSLVASASSTGCLVTHQTYDGLVQPDASVDGVTDLFVLKFDDSKIMVVVELTVVFDG